MKKFYLLIGVFMMMSLFCPVHASAQSPVRVTVSVAAPVFVQPDNKMTPLRVAKEGSVLILEADEGDWFRVSFDDPQWGRRVGYIEKRHVRVQVAASQQAVDLTVADSRQPAEATVETTPQSHSQPHVSTDHSMPTPPLTPADADQRGRTPQAAFNRREPVLALVLSWLLPGLGQVYNGPTQANKGFAMMGAEAGFITLTFIGASHPPTCSISDIQSSGGCRTSPLVPIGLLGAAGNSIYSMYDAYTTAGALNRNHGLALNVRPEVVNGRNGVRAEAQYHINW